MAETGVKILSIQMLDAVDDGIPIEIKLKNKSIQKKIPNGMGFVALNIVLNEKNEVQDAELVTEKI